MADYHVPVMGQEICDKLLRNKDGNYYDGTLGGGGHARLFLKKLSPAGHYIAVDRDEEAIAYARDALRQYSNITFYHGVFSEIGPAIKSAGVDALDGILLDLGVSSHQIDADNRGFAFRPGVRLDMRMDKRQPRTAAAILAEYELRDLSKIFREYGEERQAHRIAREVVRQRNEAPIVQSEQLMKIIARCVPGQHLTKSYARIFQALRIEVNGELDVLQQTLEASLDYLKPGGRLAVLSYHSLEDRIVKNFIRKQENPCECPPELPYCVCGKKPQMKKVPPAFIKAGTEEINKNPRARSAVLRIGERI